MRVTPSWVSESSESERQRKQRELGSPDPRTRYEYRDYAEIAALIEDVVRRMIEQGNPRLQEMIIQIIYRMNLATIEDVQRLIATQPKPRMVEVTVRVPRDYSGVTEDD